MIDLKCMIKIFNILWHKANCQIGFQKKNRHPFYVSCVRAQNPSWVLQIEKDGNV